MTEYKKKSKMRILFLPLVYIVIISLSSCSMMTAFNTRNDYVIPVPEPYVDGKLPIGMNLPELTYYSPGIIFNDVMTTASNFMTFRESSGDWDNGEYESMNVDVNGYPVGLPQNINGVNHYARFLINNNYIGRYRVFFDGSGILGGSISQDSNGYYVDLTGNDANVWIDILGSDSTDYVRNLHIIHEDYNVFDNVGFENIKNSGVYDTFLKEYLDGLRDFHSLRFMDWSNTNNSSEMHWGDRITKDYYSQAVTRGTSIDYAIELCNELHTDAWVCIPHMATDDYIRNLAILWRDNLDSGLKVYIEFSNEIWNWQFYQTHWIANNGSWPGYDVPVAADSHVISDLQNIGPDEGTFPEKSAYMMARTFSIWSDVFIDDSRIVRVATAQHAWPGNTERIMQYLYDASSAYGAIGCDALAVGGYFGFKQDIHNEWMNIGRSLSEERMYSDSYIDFVNNEMNWTRSSAEIANRYGVDYLVYEGGQHMQPFNQEEWFYNDLLYDFQITDYMYKMYMHNFASMIEEDVDCRLFMAYSYIGARESRWGSWGHLETVYENRNIVPKYKALMDINSNK